MGKWVGGWLAGWLAGGLTYFPSCPNPPFFSPSPSQVLMDLITYYSTAHSMGIPTPNSAEFK